MTIRMLKPFSGYFEGQIVSTLAPAEETRLIGLGFATVDLDGPRENFEAVTANTNPLTGGISIPTPSGAPLIQTGANANTVITKYGVPAHTPANWGNTCNAIGTIGVTSLTHSLSTERPRFSTYTRKCVLGASNAEIRFASAHFTADPADKALAIDVYIEQMPNEFLGGSNPYLTIQLSNTTSLGANYSRWVFDSGYLRQGWNTLKMREADTVSSTSGAGNLPVGCNHPADSGTGFDWTSAGRFISLTFNNMSGFTVHVDELRRATKAKPVVVIGFDACGYTSTDEIFVTKVAPLFARYGIRSYCTMTNVYELTYSGSQAWTRFANLHNNFGWDAINHTWSHGGTTEGRVITASSATRDAGNVLTVNMPAHAMTLGKPVKFSVQGATPADMNGVFDFTPTTATAMTCTQTGASGVATGTGTIKLYSFLSEVFSADTVENRRLVAHEFGDVTRIIRANGYWRGSEVVAYPNNSVPHLDVLKDVCKDYGITLGRAYRGGYTFVNELGIDNPLNFGSVVMDSGTTATRLSEIQTKVLGAIDRGEHLWIFGHFILDDEDPANAAYAPVNPDYAPSQGGNPLPPIASVAGTAGGWWYYSQLRKLIEDTIGPAIANGTLLAMSPSEYAAYMSSTK